MSPSGTPDCAAKETPTIKGELERMSDTLGSLESHIDGLVAITGVVGGEETGKDPPLPAGTPIVQQRITEVKALRERIHTLIPLIEAVRVEIDRIQ